MKQLSRFFIRKVHFRENLLAARWAIFCYNSDIQYHKIKKYKKGLSYDYTYEKRVIVSDEQAGFAWETDPQGYHIGGTGMQLTAHDAAKIGYLYLNKGQWDGMQIIPMDYVDEATQKQTSGGSPEAASYGYHWWVTQENGYDNFFAAGFGGQYIQVFPDLDLVLVMLTPNAFAVGEYHRKFITSLFVIPAIQDV